MKKTIFLLILFLARPVFAQTLTLDEVVKTVRETHPSIEAAKQDAESAKQMKKAESWLEDPMVGVIFEEVPFNSPSLGNADMTSYFVSQKIPFLGTLITKNKALNAEYKAKREMVTSREREMVFEAKKAYFELFAVMNQLKDQRSIASSYAQMIASFEAQYKSGGDRLSGKDGRKKAPTEMTSGMSGQTDSIGGVSVFADLMMAKMKKAEVETLILDLKHQEEALKARLNLLMGREAHETIGRLSEPKIKKIKEDTKTLEQKLLAQNADLKALEWMLKKSEKEVSLAAQRLIPVIEPEFMYQRRQNMDNAYQLGIGLNLPIWINRNVHEIKKAKADKLRTKADLESQTRGAKDTLHNLLHFAVEHYKIVSKYRGEIIPLAQSAANAATTAYGAGMISSSSLLQKIINLHEARKMYRDMWKDYQIEYAMLEALVGEEL
ncbi:MAG: TolC family protein [Deltaproteobacteria bacterium]|nr:TolC family protein [Deltaproteobacteria bacterium]